MARMERRHMGGVRAWRVCELHGLCEGTARVERRRTWARENGAWSGLGLSELRGGVGVCRGCRSRGRGCARERRVERAGWRGGAG